MESTDRTYTHKHTVTIRHPCSARVPVGRRVPCSVRNTFCFSVKRGMLGLDLFLDLGLWEWYFSACELTMINVYTAYSNQYCFDHKDQSHMISSFI